MEDVSLIGIEGAPALNEEGMSGKRRSGMGGQCRLHVELLQWHKHERALVPDNYHEQLKTD